jgi:hypothetical protein
MGVIVMAFGLGNKVEVLFTDGKSESFKYVSNESTHLLVKDEKGNDVLIPFNNVKYIVKR